MREFILSHKADILATITLSIIINLILRFKWTRMQITAIIDDTLKEDKGNGKRGFSGTKITMMTAFASLVWSFHYITVKDGFNDTAFITMAAIATGVGISKALSKKLDPTVVAPDSEITVKETKTDNSKETTIKEETTS